MELHHHEKVAKHKKIETENSGAIMDEAGQTLKCTMYIFPFSLYSIMARFTAALGASAGQATRPITIEHQLVNLHRNGNISEWYLLNVNPKGQVISWEISEKGGLFFDLLLTANVRFRP